MYPYGDLKTVSKSLSYLSTHVQSRCRLFILCLQWQLLSSVKTFKSKLDQNVDPDMDPNWLTDSERIFVFF